MDHAARYQLLDHATDEAALWDVWFGIVHLQEKRHRERTPDELRPELEALLREAHVRMHEMTAADQRLLTLEESLAAISDDRNWYSPAALNEAEERETIFALVLTESGYAEFQQEYELANAT